jgi:NADH-quinone oxidoreductase subunit G
MSTPDDSIDIEVDGRPVKARKGQMIIQATDACGAYVPRFCYHEKLSIAANCRMCLVEVEKAPKPMPACATPVAPGMKVYTRSPKAIGAQRATMEFLLINHPLDCPICDQGGECELQDLAMGYGRDVSRFAERKRVVQDTNLGPLVSTDMTRCIHCTRCVRFTSEIAGLQELATSGRGENMQIGTYIEKTVDHELSGNIIDLCPVGALNSKPFRYQGRAWEMTQLELVSPHDAVGANLYAHVRGGRLMRVVPRPNEAVNETWIADRDRYSYEGVYASDRVTTPMLRVGGELKAVDWETALEAAAKGLKEAIERAGAGRVGVLGSPAATTEELYLLGRLARGLGIANIDHRLRQQDFRDQAADPLYPGFALSIAELERLSAALVVGSNLRREAPLLAHRLRKAALRHGARISFLNPAGFPVQFPVTQSIVATPAQMRAELLAVALAAAEQQGRTLPGPLAGASAAVATPAHRTIAASLLAGERRLVLLGALASRHADYAGLRRVAAALAELSGATLGYLADGGNAAGAALAGCLPHRSAGGHAAASVGLDARAMLESKLDAYLLFGGIEVEEDCVATTAATAIGQARFVVALTPFLGPGLRSTAHVVLPIGTFAETSGTYVSGEGRWQSFPGAALPLGEARPGWKVLRVLANLTGLPGFEYNSSEDVIGEVRRALESSAGLDTRYQGGFSPGSQGPEGPLVDVPMYRLDAVLRRAGALQATRDGRRAATVY